MSITALFYARQGPGFFDQVQNQGEKECHSSYREAMYHNHACNLYQRKSPLGFIDVHFFPKEYHTV